MLSLQIIRSVTRWVRYEKYLHSLEPTSKRFMYALAVQNSSAAYGNELDTLTNSTFLCTVAASSRF